MRKHERTLTLLSNLSSYLSALPERRTQIRWGTPHCVVWNLPTKLVTLTPPLLVSHLLLRLSVFHQLAGVKKSVGKTTKNKQQQQEQQEKKKTKDTKKLPLTPQLWPTCSYAAICSFSECECECEYGQPEVCFNLPLFYGSLCHPLSFCFPACARQNFCIFSFSENVQRDLFSCLCCAYFLCLCFV